MNEVITAENDIRTDAFTANFADDDTHNFKLIGTEHTARYLVEIRDQRDNPDAVDRAGEQIIASIRVFKEDLRRNEDLRLLISEAYATTEEAESAYNLIDSEELCEAVEPFHVLDLTPVILDHTGDETLPEPETSELTV